MLTRWWYRVGRMSSRSFWWQFSIQFKNGNVTWWLKKAKTSSSVINNWLSICNLHTSMSKLLLCISSIIVSSIIIMFQEVMLQLYLVLQIYVVGKEIFIWPHSLSHIYNQINQLLNMIWQNYHAWLMPTGLQFHSQQQLFYPEKMTLNLG